MQKNLFSKNEKEECEMADKEKVFVFLDNLRESGVTNMWGAVPYMQIKFPKLREDEAADLLFEWINSFNERHKK